MENYHQMGCLAPRDIVARAIDAELKKSGDECVYLDVTHLDAERLKTRFPNIYKKCLSVGIDITKELIPIVPAAHYSCGGVRTNLAAESSIDRLYACGEVACTGVHGANRLASNSLLEALVFAHRASEDAERHMSDWACDSLVDYDKSNHVKPVKYDVIADLADRVHRLMWRYVGIVRTNERLEKAREELAAIAQDVEKIYSTGRLSAELLELRNILAVAKLIIDSARSRKESRGLNYNLDYPQADDTNCKKDTVLIGSGH
jgi:L-aspartate oxidase